MLSRKQVRRLRRNGRVAFRLGKNAPRWYAKVVDISPQSFLVESVRPETYGETRRVMFNNKELCDFDVVR